MIRDKRAALTNISSSDGLVSEAPALSVCSRNSVTLDLGAGIQEGEGVTDLLVDLLNSLSCFYSCLCLALSALSPFFLGEAKRLPMVMDGGFLGSPSGNCVAQTQVFLEMLSYDS